MKPDGIAKKTEKPFWHIARMPARSVLSWAKYYENRKYEQNDLGFCTGGKVFESDKKLTIVSTWFNPTTKKYKYIWTATFNFKKNGIVLFINMNAIKGKPGRKFTNATYHISHLLELFKIMTPSFRGMEKTQGRNFRQESMIKKVISLFYYKAKKEKINIGKLRKQDAKKMSLTAVMYCFGSEFLCNQVYYGLKNNPQMESVGLSPFINAHDKTSKKLHKKLKTTNSMESVVKYAWGRAGKNLIKANTTYLLYTGEKSVMKLAKMEFSNNDGGTFYNVPIKEQKQVPYLIIDTQLLLWGKRLSKYVNIDLLMPHINKLTSEITEKAKTGVQNHLIITGNNRLMDKGLDTQLDQFLMQFTEQKRTQLLSSFFNEAYNNRNVLNFIDAAEQWYPFRDKIEIPKNLKTMREVHDYVAAERRKLGTADFHLTIDDKILELDGLTIGNLRLEVPKTNHKLIEYGQKMNNCIGGYGQRVNQSKKAQWLLGVYKNDELTYNIEVNHKSVVQFWGKHNSQADAQDKVHVLTVLKEKELIRET